MTEEQILEEVAKLPKDAQRRIKEAIHNLVSDDLDPDLKELAVKVAMARYEGIKAGRRKTMTPEEFMRRARESEREAVEQTSDH